MFILEIAGGSHHHHKVKSKDTEEEAWLSALEKGELDDIGELKKMRDPANLTARQVSFFYASISTVLSNFKVEFI